MRLSVLAQAVVKPSFVSRGCRQLVAPEHAGFCLCLCGTVSLLQKSQTAVYHADLASALQQLQSTTTISDGEDEDDDVCDMSTQPGQPEDQRPRSTRPQTAGPRHTPHPAHRPATAGQANAHDRQQRYRHQRRSSSRPCIATAFCARPRCTLSMNIRSNKPHNVCWVSRTHMSVPVLCSEPCQKPHAYHFVPGITIICC